MAKGNEIIAINLDTSSDNSSSDYASTSQISTSEEIDYSSPECKGPSKSLLKWYDYLSDEYKDNDRFWGSKSAQASDASSKAIIQASGSKAKVQVSGSKAKIQASMAKASGLKAQASPKTLIVKNHVPITNCVIGLANAQTWDAILSKTFRVCTNKIIDLSSNSSDWKGVPKEGPSVASVPGEGPSIQGLLDLYGYNTVEEYLSDTYFPSTNKDSTDEDTIYEANSPMSKGKYVPRRQRGKERFHMEADHVVVKDLYMDQGRLGDFGCLGRNLKKVPLKRKE
ncbi:hypothetical protein Tco_0530326 [Tanacetum coccineum]